MNTDLCTFTGTVTTQPELYNILGHLAAASFSMDCHFTVDGAPGRACLPIIVTAYGQLAEEAASPFGLSPGVKAKVVGEMLCAGGDVTLVSASEVGFADDAEPVNLFDE